MTRECVGMIVSTLVKYSEGSDSGNPNTRNRTFPYGKVAATSTRAFKKIADACFASTMTALYPFVKAEEDKWDKMLKTCAYPVTALWPAAVIERAVWYRHAFQVKRQSVFKTYEASGGIYHGPDEDVTSRRRATSTEVTYVSDSESEDDAF